MLSFKDLPFHYLFISLSLLVPSVRGDSTCYYPDGSNATDYTYVPCKSGSGFSSCCIPSEGDVCLSNGLCYYPAAPYPFRGACTDPTFKSPECAQQCVLNTPDDYISLTSCGGTKWCCSDTSSCCSKPNLVFDIGVPSVINDYGSAAATLTGLTNQPTTGQTGIITAATTGSAAASTQVITTTNAAGKVVTSTSIFGPAETGSSSASTGTTSTSHTGLIIGVAVGVIVLLVSAVTVGVLICCLMRKSRRKQATPPMNLIDMNTPSQPQHIDTASNAQLVQKPGNGFAPEKPSWDPVPAYTPPHWQQPVNAQGQTLVELQSPIIPGRPLNAQHGPVYEMN